MVGGPTSSGGGLKAEVANPFAGILMVSIIATSSSPSHSLVSAVVCVISLHRPFCFLKPGLQRVRCVRWNSLRVCTLHIRVRIPELIVIVTVDPRYDTGIINGVQAMHDWLCTFGTNCEITTFQQSLVVSVLSIGTFLGALLGAPVADIIGRKYGVILATLVFDVGVAMQVASTGLGLFIAGRIIAGLGVGLISVLVIMYQSEW